MNSLVIQALATVPDGTLQAEGIFEKVNSLAGNLQSTVLVLVGALLYVGAVVTFVKSRFSVGSGIVAFIMVAIGTAVLSQVSEIADLFSETVKESAPAVQETDPDVLASADVLDGIVVVDPDGTVLAA